MSGIDVLVQPAAAGGGSPSGAAGGDLAGTYPNPTVSHLANVTDASLPSSGLAAVDGAKVSSGTLPLARLAGITTSQLSATAGIVSGQIASTNPSALTGTGTIPAAGLPGATTSVQGAVILATPSTDTTAGHVLQASDARVSDARIPSGSATGDLAGSYPSPTVALLTHVTNGAVPVEVSSPDFSISGIADATAGGRFVGFIAIGPPATGPYLTGDTVVDKRGRIWTCISGGSPGTWVQTGSRSATAIIAASNASAGMKAVADYVCDNVNDEVEIQAAHDALPSFGGKILLSEGLFSIKAGIDITKHSVTIEGLGIGAESTAGYLTSSYGTRILTVGAYSASKPYLFKVFDSSVTTPRNGIVIQSLTLCGGVITATGSVPIDAILWQVIRSYLFRVHIDHFTGYGISESGYSGFNSFDNIISHCQVSTCKKDGILLGDYSSDDHVTNCIVYHNGVFDGTGPNSSTTKAGGHNLHSTTPSHQITSCHFYDGANYNVYLDKGNINTKLINCKIEGASYHGLVIDGGTTGNGNPDVQVSNCNFGSNGDHGVGLPSTQYTTGSVPNNTVADSAHIYIGKNGSAGAATNNRTGLTGNNLTYKLNLAGNWKSACTKYPIMLDDLTAADFMLQSNVFGFSAAASTQPHSGATNTVTNTVSAGAVAPTLTLGTTVLSTDPAKFVVGTSIVLNPGSVGGTAERVTVASIGLSGSDQISVTISETLANTHTAPFQIIWATPAVYRGAGIGSGIIRDNYGYTTATNGTATIASGTSIVVNHGLDATPAISQISVTPQSNMGTTTWWVSNVTATQFTINTSASVTSKSFSWSAEIF